MKNIFFIWKNEKTWKKQKKDRNEQAKIYHVSEEHKFGKFGKNWIKYIKEIIFQRKSWKYGNNSTIGKKENLKSG